MTEYVYDGAGRLVESRAEREPEWDDEQRGWMLALDEFDRVSKCPVCGGLKSDCQGVGDAADFEVPAPTRCHRVTAIELASEPYRDSKVPRALMFAAYPKSQRP